MVGEAWLISVPGIGDWPKLLMMQEARKRFPGRRGKAEKVDFHYYPLTFSQFLQLKKLPKNLSIKKLYNEFNQYLIHGGFLTAINEFASTRKIST